MIPEKDKQNYSYEIKVSEKKGQEIEACAKTKGITVNHFIKEAINQSLMEYKLQISDNDILHNQLELFNEKPTQLDIGL